MLTLRSMTSADFPLLERLRAEAGWNQTEDDLRLYLRLQGDGGFVGDWEGRPVGTAMTLPFGSLAWVAMVLVEKALRGRGIGTALTERAIAHQVASGCPTLRLDATPLGRPIYEKLGFEPQFQLVRWEGILPETTGASEIVPVTAADQAEILRLDQRVSGADRSQLLEALRPTMHTLRREGHFSGFVAWRPGLHAWQLGPCLATTQDSGLTLLTAACGKLAGQRVFLDIPTGNSPASALAQRLGLRPQRELLRMTRGLPVCEPIDSLWASCGPAVG